MSSRTPPAPDGPGTLTSLLDEVFRGAGADVAWVEGLAPGSALLSVGAGYGAGHPEGVAWSNLRFLQGNADCR